MLDQNTIWNAPNNKNYIIQELVEGKWIIYANILYSIEEIFKALDETKKIIGNYRTTTPIIRAARISRYLPDHSDADVQVMEVLKTIYPDRD
jgi:hypothetical protein